MTTVMKSIHKMEKRFDERAERFAFHHPYLACLVMFIGVPSFILIAVAATTMLITFPVAWIFGWL